jgi:predicted RNA methylase
MNDAVNHTLRSIQTSLDRDKSQGSTDLWRSIESLASGEVEGELTPEVMKALLEQVPSARAGEFTTPQLVSDFISAVASMFNPDSVLDPMCGSGLMLDGVHSICEPRIIDGVDINTRTCEIARQVLGPPARIQNGNIFLAELDLQGEYDLVVSDPPLRTRMRREQIDALPGLRKQLDLGQNLVVWACRKIREDGAIIIVLDANALDRGPLVEAINAAGCRVRASFHVPAGTRPNTMLASQVVLVQRGEQDRIFVGQLSEESEHQQILLDNFKHHRFGKHPSLGRICEVAEFFGYEALEAAHTLSRRFRNTSFPRTHSRTLSRRSISVASMMPTSPALM